MVLRFLIVMEALELSRWPSGLRIFFVYISFGNFVEIIPDSTGLQRLCHTRNTLILS